MPVISCPDCQRDVSTLAPNCPHCGRPSPAMTSPILQAVGPPPSKEETVWRGSPSWMLLSGRLIGLGVAVIVIPIVTALLARGADDPEAASSLYVVGWSLALILGLIFAISVVVGLIKIRSTQYTVTNQRVLVETGIFTKTVNEIDMRLIDDSLFFQGLVHRAFGIGNVTVMSSDKNTPVFMLKGIAEPRAVRELIRTHSYQASQRQVFTRPT